MKVAGALFFVQISWTRVGRSDVADTSGSPRTLPTYVLGLEFAGPSSHLG